MEKSAPLLREVRGKRAEKGIWISFFLLLASGLVALYAASYYNAQDKGSSLSEVISQLMGVGVGAFLMAAVWKLNYRALSNPVISGAFVVVSLLLLGLVAIPGVGVYLNGSRRWLRLGPVSFQPSELAKYSMVLFMARALASPSRNIRDFWHGLVPLFIVPGMMFALVLLQPNLSTAGSIVIVAAVLTMLAGARFSHLGLIGTAGLCVGVYYAFSEPYRRARMISFVDPFRYLSNEGYQLAQSLMAFGSGGLFGMGLGRGRQKYSFLPYPESDFIFAALCEELGIAVGLFALALYVILFWRGLTLAMRARSSFHALLAVGVVTCMSLQTFMIVGGVIKLIPLTGVTMPYISYGGSSMLSCMLMLGILQGVSVAVREQEEAEWRLAREVEEA